MCGHVMAHLQDVVEHGSGVAVVRLGLARGQGHQPSPGVAQVTAVAPGQLVLVILHLHAIKSAFTFHFDLTRLVVD